MIAAASWVCLLAPLAGARRLITLAGPHAHAPRAPATSRARRCSSRSSRAVVAFIGAATSEGVRDRQHTSTLWQWLTAGNLHFGLRS